MGAADQAQGRQFNQVRVDEPADGELVVRDLSKSFDGIPVLQRVSLRLAPGRSAALLGASGSGKSTLLNLIAGLEQPDAGTIRFGDISPNLLSEQESARFRRESLGFVFQAFHLLPYLDAQRNVALPLLLAGVNTRDALDAAKTILTRLGLGQRLHALPGTLSGGEQQRVALARALVHAPRLILADEPTGNLDRASAAEALALLEREQRASGATMVLVTHDERAAAIADERWRLDRDGLSAA